MLRAARETAATGVRWGSIERAAARKVVMYRDLRVAVVVPAHNEERLVGKTVTTMPDTRRPRHRRRRREPGRHRRGRAGGRRPPGRADHAHREPGRRRRRSSPGTCGRSSSAPTSPWSWPATPRWTPTYLPALLDPIADGEAEYTKANRFFGPGLVRRHAAAPDRRQHRPVVPDQGRLRLLEPLRPAERLHRDPPVRARAAAVRPHRASLRVRERHAHPAQHPARPGAGRARSRPCTATRSPGCG